MVEGTTTGANTDGQGRYRINVPDGGTLVFSYMGYVTQRIQVMTQSVIDVTLVEDSETLDEVVVIGYGTVRKRDLTGSVVSVKSDDITIAPTGNVMEALQGRITGMDITKTGGQVGAGVNVLLRGNRSIYGSNEPLFIIDGVPGDFDSVNPSDIESVDVLKDASSTAIYGSAGSNGVVIITTRRGVEGRATVNFDAYYGFSGNPDYYKPMLGQEWTDYQREAYRYINGAYPTDMSSILTQTEVLKAYNDGKWIDWLDLAAGKRATTQKYNLSVSAGTEKTKVFASATYDKETSLIENEDQNRYALRLNLDQEIFKWATLGFSSNLNYRIRNLGSDRSFTRATSALPLGDAYDANGNIIWEYMPGFNSPLGNLIPDQHVNENRMTDVNATAYLQLNPIEGLSFRSQVSAALISRRHGRFWGSQSISSLPFYATSSPYADVNHYYGYRYTWENILTYTKTINDHSFGATLVSSWSKLSEEDFLSSAGGQMVDKWSFYRLLSGSSRYVDSNYKQAQKMGFAGRANYSYKGKYLINFSGRYDGVSWLSSGNKWDFFPAVAVAWRISDEPFMDSANHWLDNLKLRVGYGETGNSGVDIDNDHSTTSLESYLTESGMYFYTGGGLTVNGVNSPFVQYMGTYGNPGLGWEKSKNINIGIDASFLNNRIDVTLDWFKTKTDGLLFTRDTPVTSGFTAWGGPLKTLMNIAKTENTGFEMAVNSRNIVKPNFMWTTGLTLTWGKEKIVALPNGSDIEAESLFQGKAIKSIYDYDYDGIWGTDTPQTTLDAYGVKPGFVRIKTNADKDGKYEHTYGTGDRKVLGHSNPNYIIGLNNTFIYRDFDLTIYAMGRFGQTIKSSYLSRYTAPTYGASNNNQISDTDYWTETNQGAYFPAAGSGSQQTVMGALAIRDGSFIKVKNITLGYTLPKHISRVAKMERLRFYVTAYNPFVFAFDKELRGTDPESNSESYPLYKQYVFGVNITF